MTDVLLLTKPILERIHLNGRVALVTAGGQGIGRGDAHALGEAGAIYIEEESLKRNH